MKTRKRIVFLSLAAVALASIIFILLPSHRFSYGGKTLGQWLDYSTSLSLTNAWDKQQDLDRKVRQFGPAAVPPLIAELQSRHLAQNTLHQFLSKHPSKHQWIQDLDQQCYIISMRPEAAAQFLYDIGPAAAPAIPALVVAAAGPDQAVRANAINALGSIHQRPELVVPVLIRALSNSWDRNFAIYAVGRFGTNASGAAPALRQLLADNQPIDFQMSTLLTLEKIAPDSTTNLAMPVYLKVLNSPQNAYTYTVILRLLKLGPQAREAIPALKTIAGKGDELAQAAAYALKAIDPEAAAKIWTTIPRGPDMDDAFFEKQIKREESQEHFSARVRAMGDQTLPYLIKLIRSRPASGNNIPEYERAARALGELGSAARPAIPDLVEAAEDSRWFVRVPAQAALMKIKGEPLSPVIEQLKNTADSFAWYETAMLVAEFGTNAEPAIPVVISAMNGTDDIIEGHGAILLGAIHRRPEVCLPVLVSLLDSPSVSSRQKALGALYQFGDAAKPALPQITNALTDFDPFVRMQARRLLKQLNPAIAKPDDKK